MEHFKQKLNRTVYIMAIALCIAGAVTGCSPGSGSEKSAVSHQNDAKPFSVPESLTMSSSSIGGINSIYVSKQTGESYALITEESDKTIYNKGKYLSYLTETVGISEDKLDTDKAIETDSVIIYKQSSKSKIYCYINAKNLHRNIVIALKSPGDSVGAAREMIHSYLNSVGENDKNYVYSDYLAEPVLAEDANSGTEETVRTESVIVDSEAAEESPDTAASTQRGKTKVTADDLISVIDKTAAHQEGQ